MTWLPNLKNTDCQLSEAYVAYAAHAIYWQLGFLPSDHLIYLKPNDAWFSINMDKITQLLYDVIFATEI